MGWPLQDTEHVVASLDLEIAQRACLLLGGGSESAHAPLEPDASNGRARARHGSCAHTLAGMELTPSARPELPLSYFVTSRDIANRLATTY